jgi:TPP-dependent pyruvate/acetoin dehydrogenase alpha subunit
LIEAVTFRMGPHSSSDDPKRYVPKETFDAWKDRDPIERFRRYLKRENLLDDGRDQELQDAARNKVADAIRRVEKLPPPPLASMFQDVTKDLPPHLAEQLHALLEEEKAKGKFTDTSVAFPL